MAETTRRRSLGDLLFEFAYLTVFLIAAIGVTAYIAWVTYGWILSIAIGLIGIMILAWVSGAARRRKRPQEALPMWITVALIVIGAAGMAGGSYEYLNSKKEIAEAEEEIKLVTSRVYSQMVKESAGKVPSVKHRLDQASQRQLDYGVRIIWGVIVYFGGVIALLVGLHSIRRRLWLRRLARAAEAASG
jgi:Flp pilus assembly protein TadB